MRGTFRRAPTWYVILAALSWPGGATRAAMPEDHTQWAEPVFRCAYRLIATPQEMAALDTLPRSQLREYLRKFWKRRDPTPATEINEFKQQFEERIAVATERYRAVPTHAPWDRRGEIYIRFGPPDEIRERVFGWYERIGYGPPIDPTSTLLDEGEVWYYFGRNLVLQFQPMGPDFELVPVVPFGGRRAEPEALFADDLRRIETTRVAYELPVGQTMIEAVVECYPFRRSDGLYDVYVVSATPLGIMARSTGFRSGEVEYMARATALDSALRAVWTDSVRVHQGFAHIPRGYVAQNHFATLLPPGMYAFAVELDSPEEDKLAIATCDRLLVPYADTVELDLSPLVLAADIRPAAGGDNCPFVRNGREIVAVPGHMFADDIDVCFYHEVYNLSRDSNGLCTYIIEYALYDEQRGTRRKLVSREFQSEEHDTFQAGRIPSAEIEKGRYILEVKTTDLVSGVTKTALTRLRID